MSSDLVPPQMLPCVTLCDMGPFRGCVVFFFSRDSESLGVVIPLDWLSGSAALAGLVLAREIFIRRFSIIWVEKFSVTHSVFTWVIFPSDESG
jgi:hypothetical protein